MHGKRTKSQFKKTQITCDVSLPVKTTAAVNWYITMCYKTVKVEPNNSHEQQKTTRQQSRGLLTCDTRYSSNKKAFRRLYHCTAPAIHAVNQLSNSEKWQSGRLPHRSQARAVLSLQCRYGCRRHRRVSCCCSGYATQHRRCPRCPAQRDSAGNHRSADPRSSPSHHRTTSRRSAGWTADM